MLTDTEKAAIERAAEAVVGLAEEIGWAAADRAQAYADAATLRALIERMRADPDAATGCADDQIWRDVPVEALRAALPTPPTDAKGDV